MKKTLLERFTEKYVVDPGGCWLWTAYRHALGYGHFRVGRKLTAAHRFAYTAYVGEIPEGMDVCHTCDVRHCVNPKHLWLGTAKENVRDMWVKGRAPDRASPNYRGHKRPDNPVRNRVMLGKLSPAQVIEIRTTSERPSSLARRFNVDPAVISHVRAGRTYKDIQP